MNEWSDSNWELRHEIIQKCRISALYHRKRERFFALCDKLSVSLSLIAGASATTDLLGTADAKAIAGAVVVLVTMPSIVFSWTDKARLHGLLASKFIALEADIEGSGVLEEAALHKFKERALKLDMEEPAQLSALTRICQNELSFASGNESNMKEIKFIERKFAHFFDFPVKS